MSLTALRELLASGVPAGHGDDDAVRRQWWAALATLQDDFLLPLPGLAGVWLAAPLPALFEPRLLQQLQGWVWAPQELDALLSPPPALLPAEGGSRSGEPQGEHFTRLPLADDDGTDPLLLVLTPELQMAMAIDGRPGARRLLLRFEPSVLSSALGLIHERLERNAPEAAAALRQQLQTLGSLHSDEGLALRFWARLSERLAAMAPSLTLQPLVSRAPTSEPSKNADRNSELALLEAITHEVRTPLATIRTLIRSLLRRSDVGAIVRQRLEQIDGECSEQIDRFGLIFLAAELQRQPAGGGGHQNPGDTQHLARTDLGGLLRQLEPLWQRQLSRRGLSLGLVLDDPLPQVLSDPARLETMLGGLIDRFSRSLADGSSVHLSLSTAGEKLKLRLSCSTRDRDADAYTGSQAQPQRSLVGPVLSWDPSTGSLQLSRQATQQLFEQMGGRLTERSGSGLTVYFPIC